MAKSGLLQKLHQIGWEFWLPLPIVAALFWLTGNLIILQVLSRSHDSVNILQADIHPSLEPSMSILTINAEIDRSRSVSTVVIKATNSTLKQISYEFPVTQTDQIEAAIAQELGIPASSVRKLISYQIKDERSDRPDSDRAAINSLLVNPQLLLTDSGRF